MAARSEPHVGNRSTCSWSPANSGPTARSTDEKSFQISPPAISLPKGGGAIRGIGEKFAANPVTGSSTFSIPLPASPGRGGFGPQLALELRLGQRQWRRSGSAGAWRCPSITRKTDKGLPRYADGDRHVPDLRRRGSGSGSRCERPRSSTTTARPCPATRSAATARASKVCSRASSAGPVVTATCTGGRSPRTTCVDLRQGLDQSRISDPADPTRIFSWLISETRDDKGNAILYEYKGEDGTGRRPGAGARAATAADARVRPARRTGTSSEFAMAIAATLLDRTTRRRPRDLTQPRSCGTPVGCSSWCSTTASARASNRGSETWRCRPDLEGNGEWACVRPVLDLSRRLRDPHLSSVPARADVPSLPAGPRSRRSDCLVRSLDFAYRDAPQEHDAQRSRVYSFLEKRAQWSYQRDSPDAARYRYRSLPPVEFTYSEATIDDQVREVDTEALENLPGRPRWRLQWIDLDGEGLSGVLTEQAGAWYYKPNLGAGSFGPAVRPAAYRSRRGRPSPRSTASRQQLMDVQGNGALDLVDFHSPLAGFHERDEHGGWKRVHALRQPAQHRLERSQPALRRPHRRRPRRRADHRARGLHLVSVAGRRKGFGAAERTAIPLDERDGPRVVFADGEQAIYLADMSGDGLSDIVRIRNGQVCYWPNLGYGRFGTTGGDGRARRGSTTRTCSTSAASVWPTSTAAAPPISSTSAATARGCGSTAAATPGARRASCRSRSPPATSTRSRSPTCSATAPPASSGRPTCPATRAGRCATST